MNYNTLLFLCFTLTMTGELGAQRYTSAFGGKLGYGLSASYKTFRSKNGAIEAFAGLHWAGTFMGGVQYLHHQRIHSVRNLKWYIGVGSNAFHYTLGESEWLEFGVSGTLGLEYVFEKLPATLSFDIMPTFVVAETDEFFNAERFRTGYIALSGRYVFDD